MRDERILHSHGHTF